MAIQRAFILILCIFVSNIIGSYPNEDPVIYCGHLPPTLWCKNSEIGEKCGFASSCAKYRDQSLGQRLKLTVLYESLCPDSQDFITDQLYNDVYLNFAKYVDIELVAYGKANRSENGTITCQHGPRECEINLFEQCAIHFIRDPIPFIYCLELKLKMKQDFDDAKKSCSQKCHISYVTYDQILHCSKSKQGKDLQIEAAKQTESAYPDKLLHVPWLYFNNASLEDAQFFQRGLPTFICDSLLDEKPDICSGLG